MISKKKIHDAIDSLYGIPDAEIIIRRYIEGLLEAFKSELAHKSSSEYYGQDISHSFMTLFESANYEGAVRMPYDLQPSNSGGDLSIKMGNDQGSPLGMDEPCCITLNNKEFQVPSDCTEMLVDLISSPDLREIVLSHYNLIVKPFSNTEVCPVQTDYK